MTGRPVAGRSLRSLAGVLAALAMSLTGTRVSAIALPWFVLVTTGSATMTGLVAFCEMAPYVLVKLFVGPLVDHLGPRRVSWVADVVSAAGAGAVALLHALGLLAFPVLLGLVALIGAARGPGDLAKEIMVPEAAERGRIPLERAAALSGVTERLAATVGPAMGGALVALAGPLAGLAASGACFALGSVVIVWALPRARTPHAGGPAPTQGSAEDRVPVQTSTEGPRAAQASAKGAVPVRASAESPDSLRASSQGPDSLRASAEGAVPVSALSEGPDSLQMSAEGADPLATGDHGPGRDSTGSAGERAGYWRRFAEGVGFLRGEPMLLALALMVAVTNLLDAAFAQVLVPVWARESGHGPAVIGLNSSVMGLAAVGGSLVAAAVAHRMRRRVVFFVAFLLSGPPRFLVLAMDAPVWVIVIVFAMSGLSGGLINPILGAIFFERVPRWLLGRVNALTDSLAWAGIPLGGLIAGAAVAAAGLSPVLVACGTGYFLTIGLTGLRREWREMDRSRGAGTAVEPGADRSGGAAGGQHGGDLAGQGRIGRERLEDGQP
ncbi:MFS transporter [Nonomuraea sp. NEAU-A123]|uniref:MFS transporter n=1 Tax=Nonomuraea sp. NEAU-A123 TaxID=2839649 RepID=UPI001BE48A49|nr:MFS transporter [Nonomuraea sp. NEAU-A123]MBT2227538.1 MFS transporter [Nonomuraea sp. NEAU-A123]